MKLITSFDNFLNDVVNLNPDRINTATDGIEAISSFLKNDTLFGQIFIVATPQGSYRHKTIIKPSSIKLEFDVDLLVELQTVDEWGAKDYLENLHKIFKNSGRYKDIVDRRNKNRCVTIDYASDFHIDIIPTIIVGTTHYIMNKKTNEFELTDGEGYGTWFKSQNATVGGDHLIKVIRLIKYIRDYGTKIQAKSVLLTTLVASAASAYDDSSTSYPDVPTTLLTLSARVNQYLQDHPIMPLITNPVLPSEDFNRHWDQQKYTTFRDQFDELTSAINDAYYEDDKETSVELWRKVLGDDFAPATKSKSAAVPTAVDPWYSEKEQYLSDLGINERLDYQIEIDATVTRDGFRPFSLLANRFPIFKSRGLEFKITRSNVPQPYDVYWKVKNQSEEARRLGELRGEITQSLTKTESSRYQGHHYVECYAVIGDVCVAKRRISVGILARSD